MSFFADETWIQCRNCGELLPPASPRCRYCQRAIVKIPAIVRERFMSYVDTSGECWTWTGAKNRKGYGVFRFGRRKNCTLAHRLALAFEGVDIPEGKVVMHRCDNPSCVRPSHLAVGTQADNMRDAAAKGRMGRKIRSLALVL